jgi:hypothetical protein
MCPASVSATPAHGVRGALRPQAADVPHESARVTEGRVADTARAVSAVSLVIWAWQEVEQGPNVVRRGVGAAAPAALVARLAGAEPQ